MKLYEFKNYVSGMTQTNLIVSDSIEKANQRNNELLADELGGDDWKKRALNGEFCCEIKIKKNITVI